MKIKMQSAKNERFNDNNELEVDDAEEKKDDGMIDEMNDEQLEPMNPP
jgi:hypothetical protein